jgi:hypothetical protein
VKYILYPFLFACLLPLALPGQSEFEESSSSKSVLLLSLKDEIRELHANVEGEPTLLKIPSARFPAPVQLQPDEDGRLSFFTERKNEEETLWVPAASATLPPEIQSPLLLFFPTGNQEQPYRVHVLEFSEKTVPAGSFFLINLTGKSVKGRIGGANIELASGRSQSLKPSVDSRTLEVLMLYADAKDREALLTTTWFYNPRHRYLVFLYPDQETDRVGIRTVRQFQTP